MHFCHLAGKPILCSDYFIVFWHLIIFYKNVNTLIWDLHRVSKCVISTVLSISLNNSISPKMSLTTFLHSHDNNYIPLQCHPSCWTVNIAWCMIIWWALALFGMHRPLYLTPESMMLSHLSKCKRVKVPPPRVKISPSKRVSLYKTTLKEWK